MIWPQILAIVAGYLVGSISFTRVVARGLIPTEEISTTEIEVEGTSETWVYTGVSATSLLSRAGVGWMLAVILLDATKAAIPTLSALVLFPDQPVYLAVALAVVVGHIWPVWHRFEGGRGQSSILGALIVIDPVSIVFAILVGALVGLTVFTSAYAARNGSAAVLPLWFLWSDGWGVEFAFSCLLSLIFLIGSRSDIAEEIRVRAATGISVLRWRERLNKSITDFLSLNDA